MFSSTSTRTCTFCCVTKTPTISWSKSIKLHFFKSVSPTVINYKLARKIPNCDNNGTYKNAFTVWPIVTRAPSNYVSQLAVQHSIAEQSTHLLKASKNYKKTFFTRKVVNKYQLMVKPFKVPFNAVILWIFYRTKRKTVLIFTSLCLFILNYLYSL